MKFHLELLLRRNFMQNCYMTIFANKIWKKKSKYLYSNTIINSKYVHTHMLYLIYIGSKVLISLGLLHKSNKVPFVQYKSLSRIQSRCIGHFYNDSSMFQCTYMSLDLEVFIPDSRWGITDLRYAFTSIPLQKMQK